VGVAVSGLKTVLKGLVGVALLVVGPVLLAGSWDLPTVWAFIGVYVGFLLLAWFTIFRKDRDLLRERQQSGPGAKRWDRTWLTIYSVFLYGTLIAAILDVGRFHWSDTVPLWLQIAGFLGFAASLALVGWAMAANTFFSEVVRIQHDRGHHVIKTGPYRYVRHPGYLGNVFAWPCTALAIGSWLALLPAAVVVVLYVVRTALEDQALQQELNGYVDYTQQVRYRLIPGVW
jgi:protein-S-isoprenylcysteine O-methyltransferase Ste14